jgi:hypothetical protein
LCVAVKNKELTSLSYRFGVPGDIELAFPTSLADSLAQFRYAHYFRFQTDRTEVSFSIGDYDYSVFDYYEQDVKPPITRGISVTNSSGKDNRGQLLCSGPTKSELQKLEGLIPCDRENALASCE